MEKQKGIKRAYKLKEPTVAGLVEKLSAGDYINSNEIPEVRNALAKATENMDSMEVAYVINTLDKKIDAPSSDIVTSDGFNYSVFEKTLKEASNTVQEKKIEKNSRRMLQDKSVPGKNTEKENKLSEEDKLEIESNKKSIDSAIKNVLGLKDYDLDDETKGEMAKCMLELRKFQSLVDKLMEKGLSKEDAKKEACKTMNVSQDYFESHIMNAAKVQIIASDIEREAKEKNKSVDDIAREYEQKHPDKVEEISGLVEENIQSKSFTEKLAIAFTNQMERHHKEKLTKSNNNIFSYVNSDKIGDIDDLRKASKKMVEQRAHVYKNQNFLENLLNKRKSKEEQGIEIEFYEKMKNEYLTTDQSISDIYEKYKHTKKFANFDFEDMLQGIVERLSVSCKSREDKEALKLMQKNERKIRITDITLLYYDMTKNSAKGENKGNYDVGSNFEKIKEYKVEKEKRKNIQMITKKCFCLENHSQDQF